MKNLFFSTMFSMVTMFGFGQNANYQIHNTKGDEYVKKGDTINAISEYSKTIELSPKNYYALKKRGLLKSAKRNYEDAVKDLTTCISIKQNDPEAYYQRGLAKQKLAGDPGVLSFTADPLGGTMTPNSTANNIWAEILNDYKIAIKLNPNLVDAYFQSAYIKNKRVLGDLGEPIEDYNSIIKIQPTNTEVLILRGVYNVNKAKDYQSADSDFTAALAINPNDSVALQNIVSSKIFLQKYDEAVISSNKYISVCPKSGIGYYLRGMSKFYLKDFLGCVQDFDKAIIISPDEPTYYVNRGYVKITELKLSQEGCKDFISAKNLGFKQAQELIDQYCK